MSKIALMSPDLANLIAAGEVIERPSSVVKELVENSIDAESKNIYIGVLDAGKGKILVKDDGSGMDREDASNCFLRHASSKLKSEFELNHIHTLGFRGEAIPSIASVSEVILTTSDGLTTGTRVVSKPNTPLLIENSEARKGTIFEVSNLFYNTPARLKYLKSEQVENYNIIETCEKLALGFPNIAFTLHIDDRDVFKTSGRGDLLECIQKIYTNRVACALLPIKKETFAFTITGFIAKPEINYSRRKEMFTFLNHRAIYNYKFNKAIENAYKDYLPPQRYPFVIINLDIDAALVDVNVHPTKKEVRISNEDEIAMFLEEEIKRVLASNKPIYDSFSDIKSTSYFKPTKEEESEHVLFADPLLTDKKSEMNSPSNSINTNSLPLKTTYEPKRYSSPQQIASETKEYSNPKTRDYYSEVFADRDYLSTLPSMHPIGQILDTYIVCDSSDGFYLIDQHAAAERINFEKTKKLYSEIKSRIIPLIPLVVDLTPKEMNNIDDEHLERLKACNIIAEQFGPSSIRVTEIPAFLENLDINDVIEDSVHACLTDEKVDVLSLLHLTIANIACKKSIKAYHNMSISEIEALIKNLAKCENPANCPHGRPTLIKISKADIEKLFRRTGF